MARVDTLPEYLRPLMDGVTVRTPYCAVCGRTYPLNQHHVVRRGAGKMYRGGREVEKPTVTLCGFGNNLHDDEGREYCHGLAHANRLHFRWVKTEQPCGEWFGLHASGGHWEYLRTDEPVKYSEALKMDGWVPLRRTVDC